MDVLVVAVPSGCSVEFVVSAEVTERVTSAVSTVNRFGNATGKKNTRTGGSFLLCQPLVAMNRRFLHRRLVQETHAQPPKDRLAVSAATARIGLTIPLVPW